MRTPVQIEWWGTAAFRIRYGAWTALLDPYLTRNPYARPRLTVDLDEAAAGADHVFLSHGHFDHVGDIPAIQSRNSRVVVYGPGRALKAIRRDGGDDSRLREVSRGKIVLSPEVSVEVLPSEHVKFDLPLVAGTLIKALVSPATPRYLRPSLITKYPCGETLSYILNLGGFRIQFLGSAGSSPEILASWSRAHGPVDCLLVPLQGNSRICRIAADIVEGLRPKAVIPHHHDNFFPPVSKSVDIREFRELVAKRSPETRLIELSMGKPYLWESADRRPSARRTPEASL